MTVDIFKFSAADARAITMSTCDFQSVYTDIIESIKQSANKGLNCTEYVIPAQYIDFTSYIINNLQKQSFYVYNYLDDMSYTGDAKILIQW